LFRFVSPEKNFEFRPGLVGIKVGGSGYPEQKNDRITENFRSVIRNRITEGFLGTPILVGIKH